MTTKIHIGDRLRNNDPRCPVGQKEVIVTGVFDHDMERRKFNEPYVTYQARTRTATIKLDRIFFDGKTRHQGYNYVGQSEQKYGFKVGDKVRILPGVTSYGVAHHAIGTTDTIDQVHAPGERYGLKSGWSVRQEHLEPATPEPRILQTPTSGPIGHGHANVDN